MARIESIIDDLTGATLNETVEPTVITVDGTKYSLDLGSASKDRLIKWLSGEGSLINAAKAAPKATSGTSSADKEQNVKVRHWAHSTKHKIDGKALGEKGRIPDAFVQAWKDAGSPDIS